MNLPLRALSVAITASMLLLTGCGDKDEKAQAAAAQGQQMPQATVDIQIIELGAVPIIHTFSGRVSASESSEVRPQATGIIDEILFQEGAPVKEGQPLYRINTDNYASSVAASEAALNQARANVGTARASIIAQKALYDKARADLSRYEELLKVDAISQQAYDQAITNVKTTKAGVEQAEANLKSAEASVRTAEASVNASRLDLNRTIVRAPISGRSGISSVTKGALVSSGQAASLVTISRLDPVFIDISQSSSDLLRLRQQFANGSATQGSPEVQIVLEDGTPYPMLGQLALANAQVDEATGSVTLRAVFPNPDNLLLPGMFINARLNLSVAENATLLPKTAVTINPKGEAQVYIVNKDNKIEVRPIVTDGTLDGQWIVTGGLKTGDKVVVTGGHKLKPEQEVKTRLLSEVPAGAPAGTQAPTKAGQNSVMAPQAPSTPNANASSTTSAPADPKAADKANTDTKAPTTQPTDNKDGSGATDKNAEKITLTPTSSDNTQNKEPNPRALSPEEQELLDSADESN